MFKIGDIVMTKGKYSVGKAKVIYNDLNMKDAETGRKLTYGVLPLNYKPIDEEDFYSFNENELELINRQ